MASAPKLVSNGLEGEDLLHAFLILIGKEEPRPDRDRTDYLRHCRSVLAKALDRAALAAGEDFVPHHLESVGAKSLGDLPKHVPNGVSSDPPHRGDK